MVLGCLKVIILKYTMFWSENSLPGVEFSIKVSLHGVITKSSVLLK